MDPVYSLRAAFQVNGQWHLVMVSGRLFGPWTEKRSGGNYGFSTDTDLFGGPGGSMVPLMKLNQVWGQYNVSDQSICWFIVTPETDADATEARRLLTSAMVNGINGCGGKGGWCRPIKWFSCTPWCNRHDVAYFNGGSETDRHAADQQLRSDLMHLADQVGTNWLKRGYYRVQAQIYYAAVRLAGWEFFSYDTPMPTNPFARLWHILRG